MLTRRALQVRMLKESLPHMRAAGKGQVIITTSLVGFSAFPFTDAYSASKFALEGGALSQPSHLVSLTASSFSPGCHHLSLDSRACPSVKLSLHHCHLCPRWQGSMAGLMQRGLLYLSCLRTSGPNVLLALHFATQDHAMQDACRLQIQLHNAGLAEAMAPQLSKFGISMSLVEPGPVSTPFMENIDKNTAPAQESAAKEPSDDYT